MAPEDDSHVSRDAGSAERELVRTQREMNGELMLASLRAHEAVDKAEAEREWFEERLASERETAEIRERLLGIIGHDLRNPLNAMMMGAGILIAHGNQSEEDKRVVMGILAGAHRMERMIGQILDFTRARLGGGFQLELRPTDLGEVCRNVAEEFALGRSAAVRCITEGDLTGSWDGDRLAEIFSNIAGNAIEHARVGTCVVLHAFGEGSDVVVEISNEGDPIPADVLPFIFEPFRRAKKQEHSKAGNLGLGLYIACELTRAHRGTLVARSGDGRTTFTVRLPRRPPPSPSQTAGARPA